MVSASVSAPVSMMIGHLTPAPRISRQASRPSMSGRPTSRMMTSKCSALASLDAARGGVRGLPAKIRLASAAAPTASPAASRRRRPAVSVLLRSRHPRSQVSSVPARREYCTAGAGYNAAGPPGRQLHRGICLLLAGWPAGKVVAAFLEGASMGDDRHLQLVPVPVSREPGSLRAVERAIADLRRGQPVAVAGGGGTASLVHGGGSGHTREPARRSAEISRRRAGAGADGAARRRARPAGASA